MRKLNEFPRYNAWHVHVRELSVKREPDGCYYVANGMNRGPKKHSRKAALLAFWNRGFIAPCRT